jgi:hypothetical protein
MMILENNNQFVCGKRSQAVTEAQPGLTHSKPTCPANRYNSMWKLYGFVEKAGGTANVYGRCGQAVTKGS